MLLSCPYAKEKGDQEELFINFQFIEFVPEEKLYRRLKGILNLDDLYKTILLIVANVWKAYKTVFNSPRIKSSKVCVL